MNCHLCGASLDDALTVGTKARHGHESHRVACRHCGLVQVAPQPDADELAAFYSSGAYRREHGPVPLNMNGQQVVPGTPGYDYAQQALAKGQATRVVQGLRLPPGASILEVGCGEGRTAAHVKGMGYSVSGREPDKQAAAEARERLGEDWRVRAEGWPLTYYPETDLVDGLYMLHVLEHFADPLAALDACHDVLKPGGRLLVEVPNVMLPSGPLEHHFQWVHLFDFSAHTLRALLLRAGFVNVEVGQIGGQGGSVCNLVATATLGERGPHAVIDPVGPGGVYMKGWLDCYRTRLEVAA